MPKALRRAAGIVLIGVGALVAIIGWQISSVCTIESGGQCIAYRFPDAWILGVLAAAPMILGGALLLLRAGRPDSPA